MNNPLFRTIMLVLAMALAPAGGASAVTVDVQYGWGEVLRPGRWTPIYITLSNPTSHNVLLDLYAPSDRNLALRIRQQVTIGPTPTTFAIYAPLTYSLDETLITVRDTTPPHRTLERVFLEQRDPETNVLPRSATFAGYGQMVIGATGQAGTWRLLAAQFAHQQTQVGFLGPARLPVVPVGYDALDVLLLNQPNLLGVGSGAISLDAQRAIAQWIHAGGVMLVIPGAEPFPTSGPLVDLLPAQLGENREVEISREARIAAHLPQRFERLAARELFPHQDADHIELLPETDAVAYGRRVGFGYVAVLSVDASGLQFDGEHAAGAFWRPVLERAHLLLDEARQQPSYLFYAHDQRKTSAVQHNMDLVGNVPGIGRFGFSYVAIVLLAIMVLVGPVDWLVLKWLGRQPWTWATTAGWIGVLTGGAIVLGSLVRSGDLHYRTLRVIDQADNAVLATIDFAGIYSPQTTFYAIDARDGWWQMPSAEGYGGRGGMRIELPSRQSPEGNVPQEMLINVWNLRFLEGEQIEPAPPLIEADLAVQDEQITGRVTNLSDRPLTRLEFRTKDGVYRADASLTIEAGQTVEVQARRDPAASIDPQPHPHSYGPWGYYGEVQSPTEPNYVSAGDLSIRRSQRVEGMLRQRNDVVCVYAMVQDAEPAVHLHNDGAIEQHWQVIRALLPLRR